ncbi:MAG: zinc ABC transporter substrate-binding protein [Planctomycetes bacterium]|nr:zinc ABC transporter substrate-binding protein [Planctomycetota bacterium]
MSTSHPHNRILAACLLCASLAGAQAPAKLRIVATVPDLADLLQRIGGDRVAPQCLTTGQEDLHLVRTRPSLLIQLRRADAFVQLGLDAEHAWVPPLLRSARNAAIQPSGKGFCDASRGVKPLQVPQRTNRGAGPDIHPYGNPHYNLDPRRMRTAARNVCALLERLDPPRTKDYRARLAAWEKELDRHLVVWKRKLAPFRGAQFLEYHNAWVYFADAFELKVAGQLEPAPGLAPTPTHLAKMIDLAKRERIGLIVARPQRADLARRVARDAGAEVALLQLGSSSEGSAKGWFAFMTRTVDAFAARLRKP